MKWEVKDASWVCLDDEKVDCVGERVIEVTEDTIVKLKVHDDLKIAIYSIELSPNSSSPKNLPVEIK